MNPTYKKANGSDASHYATRTVMKARNESGLDLLSKVKTDILPLIKSQNGLRRIYILQDEPQKSGEIMLFTLWDSKEDADKFVQSEAYDGEMSLVERFLETSPVSSGYSVLSHFINAEDLPAPETSNQS